MKVRRSVPALLIGVASAFAWTLHTTAAPGGPQQPAAARPQGQAAPPVNNSRTTKEELEGWMKELSNWGRWGKEDELGAPNLITAAKRMQALALAKTGETVSLSHDAILEKAVDAATPFEHQTTVMAERGIAVERQQVSFHGSTFSHLDALCHIAHEGKLYNGFSFQQVVSEAGGCAKLGITGLKNGIVTRGILLDIPRLKGVPYLEPGTHVYIEDVEAWEKKAGIKVAAGDAIFLRTGRWARRAKNGPFANLAGFDASFAPFLKRRDIALIGSDGVLDAGTVPGFPLAVHTVALVALGVNIFDNVDLEALSETAARLNRWEFLLIAAPIPVPSGTGSVINPIAIF
jgi:kynurenine formamidase